MTKVVSAGNSGAGAQHDRRPGHGEERDHGRRRRRACARSAATDGCGVPDTGANSAKDIIDFSSRGPTDDGRHQARHRRARAPTSAGAQPQTGADFNGSGTCNPQFPAGSSLYTLVSGTSQAAPEVTGFAALVRDWYAREEGGGTAPSPAHDQGDHGQHRDRRGRRRRRRRRHERQRPDPGPGLGPGEPAATSSTAPRASSSTRPRGWAPPAQRDRRIYAVANAAKPLKVTLAWTDTPGPDVRQRLRQRPRPRRARRRQDLQGQRVRGRPARSPAAPPTPATTSRTCSSRPGSAGRSRSTSRRPTSPATAFRATPTRPTRTTRWWSRTPPPATEPVLVHDLSTPTEIGDGDGRLEPGRVVPPARAPAQPRHRERDRDQLGALAGPADDGPGRQLGVSEHPRGRDRRRTRPSSGSG